MTDTDQDFVVDQLRRLYPDEIAAVEAQAVRVVAKKIENAYERAKLRADTESDPKAAMHDRHYADGLSIAAGIALHETERLERR